MSGAHQPTASDGNQEQAAQEDHPETRSPRSGDVKTAVDATSEDTLRTGATKQEPTSVAEGPPRESMNEALDASDSGQARPRTTPVLITDKSERLRWTEELHACFVKAAEECGGAIVAKPKEILEAMNVPGLSIAQCKSHLQKYRIHVQNKQAKEAKGRDASGASKRRRLSQDDHLQQQQQQQQQDEKRQRQSSPSRSPTKDSTFVDPAPPPISSSAPTTSGVIPLSAANIIPMAATGAVGTSASVMTLNPPIVPDPKSPEQHVHAQLAAVVVAGASQPGSGVTTNEASASAPLATAGGVQLQDLPSDAAHKLQEALNLLATEAAQKPSGGTAGPQQQHAPPSSLVPTPAAHLQQPLRSLPKPGNNNIAGQFPRPVAGRAGFPPMPPPQLRGMQQGWPSNQQQPFGSGLNMRSPPAMGAQLSQEVRTGLNAMAHWPSEQRQVALGALGGSPALQLAQLVELALQQQMASALALQDDLQKLLEQHQSMTQNMHQRLSQLISATNDLQRQSLAPMLAPLLQAHLPGALEGGQQQQPGGGALMLEGVSSDGTQPQQQPGGLFSALASVQVPPASASGVDHSTSQFPPEGGTGAGQIPAALQALAASVGGGGSIGTSNTPAAGADVQLNQAAGELLQLLQQLQQQGGAGQ